MFNELLEDSAGLETGRSLCKPTTGSTLAQTFVPAGLATEDRVDPNGMEALPSLLRSMHSKLTRITS